MLLVLVLVLLEAQGLQLALVLQKLLVFLCQLLLEAEKLLLLEADRGRAGQVGRRVGADTRACCASRRVRRVAGDAMEAYVVDEGVGACADGAGASNHVCARKGASGRVRRMDMLAVAVAAGAAGGGGPAVVKLVVVAAAVVVR